MNNNPLLNKLNIKDKYNPDIKSKYDTHLKARDSVQITQKKQNIDFVDKSTVNKSTKQLLDEHLKQNQQIDVECQHLFNNEKKAFHQRMYDTRTAEINNATNMYNPVTDTTRLRDERRKYYVDMQTKMQSQRSAIDKMMKDLENL